MVAGWRDRAACEGWPVEDFFPDRGRSVPPEVAGLCQGCPVRAECLADALDWEQLDGSRPHGYRAGMTPAERWDLLRARRRAA